MKAASKDELVYQGTPAPFTGVLVPEENYRMMLQQDYENEILNRRMKEMADVRPNEGSWFLTGALAGIGTGVFLSVFLLNN